MNPIDIPYPTLVHEVTKFVRERVEARAAVLRPELMGYLANGSVGVFLDSVSDEIVVRLTDQIFKRELKERIAIDVPLNWWETLKEEHAPAWFLRRWPVKYKKHVVTVAEVIPPSSFKAPPGSGSFLEVVRRDWVYPEDK